MKKIISASTGSRTNPVHATVQLNGVNPDALLTPKMARMAARIAFGHCNQVTVRDNHRGYRLYKNSARKLKDNENENPGL